MSYYSNEYTRFKCGLNNLQKVQETILKKVIENIQDTVRGKSLNLKGIKDYEEFRNQVPLLEYKHVENLIDRQMQGEENLLIVKCNRYQPTSGSTSKRKWIPYPAEFTKELDHAIGPWMYDLYQTYPKVCDGKHYWSLSWLPDELRGKVSTTSDLNIFPLWQRTLMNQTMAAPQEIALADTSFSAQLATLIHLICCPELSMIFVWSPTFALSLFNLMQENRELILEMLKSRSWTKYSEELKNVPFPNQKSSERVYPIISGWDKELTPSIFKALWPKLEVVSSWDSSTSWYYAEKLRTLFPDTQFQGKGLFATEGVVTIPFQNHFPLAYQSHFYEFEDLRTNKIIPSWELEVGMVVRPILTNSSGLIRYPLNDKLEVYNFLEGCPCLKFMGRIGDIDMVGEKISVEACEHLYREVKKNFNTLTPITTMGIVNNGDDKPFYCVLFQKEGQFKESDIEKLRDFCDQLLRENYHYDLARNLDQLEKCYVIISHNAFDEYKDLCKNKNVLAGDLKIEPLMQLPLMSLDIEKVNFRTLKEEVDDNGRSEKSLRA